MKKVMKSLLALLMVSSFVSSAVFANDAAAEPTTKKEKKHGKHAKHGKHGKHGKKK